MLRIPRRIACSLLLYSTVAWPQANSATFYGSVTDPTGAVVPAAVVSLIAQDTGTALKKVVHIRPRRHLHLTDRGEGLPAFRGDGHHSRGRAAGAPDLHGGAGIDQRHRYG